MQYRNFDIYANNGFNYEYVTSCEARSVGGARRWFRERYAGDHRTEDFKVRALQVNRPRILPPSPLERAKLLAEWYRQCREAEDYNDPRNERYGR